MLKQRNTHKTDVNYEHVLGVINVKNVVVRDGVVE